EDLHKDPNNYNDWLKDNTSDSSSIATYYENLDFSDFATNAQWAEWVFDNPGVDTDGDGYAGEYILIDSLGDPDDSSNWFWYQGDGVPDFKGPPPPNSPRLDVEVDKGKVKLCWTSINPGEPETGSEDSRDTFNGQKDFEGYKIYMSYDEMTWSLLRHFDKIDWVPEVYDSLIDDWVLNPNNLYPVDDTTGLGGDTLRWVAHDFNIGFDEIYDSTVVISDDTVKYYSYEMTGLSEARGVYFAVTAFDFGDPITKLSPLESSKSINSKLVYPIKKTDPVMVYPNPYKISNTQDYINAGFESPGDPYGWVEQDRRIWFSNLPDDQWAIIRIWTLDGDLVRAITYDPRDLIGYATGTVYWDLISRNTQAVVSGLYLYSIEYHSIVDGIPDKEPEIGKFAIIK
ncbi:MAG: hypothetical protein DRP26_04420, partial [Candidatus Zixiibacteriota bacterium]